MTDAGTTGDTGSTDEAVERMEVERSIPAPPEAIFSILRDPQGHVDIDSSGMLMDAEGEPVSQVGDTFVVHMDREALNDFPLGLYDVTVSITRFEQDRLIEWTILGRIRPQIGHVYGYTATTVRPSSPRTTTGPRSTPSGGRRASSRSCPRGRCGRRWGSSPGLWRGPAAEAGTSRPWPRRDSPPSRR
jgi:hypothetical protein